MEEGREWEVVVRAWCLCGARKRGEGSLCEKGRRLPDGPAPAQLPRSVRGGHKHGSSATVLRGRKVGRAARPVPRRKDRKRASISLSPGRRARPRAPRGPRAKRKRASTGRDSDRGSSSSGNALATPAPRRCSTHRPRKGNACLAEAVGRAQAEPETLARHRRIAGAGTARPHRACAPAHVRRHHGPPPLARRPGVWWTLRGGWRWPWAQAAFPGGRGRAPAALDGAIGPPAPPRPESKKSPRPAGNGPHARQRRHHPPSQVGQSSPRS
jgi:hypothetical protein